MKAPDALAVTEQVRECVARLAERLGAIATEVDRGWDSFAVACGLDLEVAPPQASVVVVGAPASVLRRADALNDDFGFVMPVAQIARPWQRSTSWRSDATLDLWARQWTPIAIDRVLLAVRDVRIELVIGNARRTPESPNSALDNSN